MEQIRKMQKDQLLKSEVYEKANKITMAEYVHPQFFYDGIYHLTSELDIFIDDAWSCGIDIPRYVWGVIPYTALVRRDTFVIFQGDLDALGHDDISWFDVRGVKELDRALKTFYEANRSLISYCRDPTTVILIDKEVDEYMRMLDEN